MFVGRTKELETLESLYKKDKFEFVVIYGRRRVGKTALINKFIEHKKAIYYVGVESNERQNLENFSKCIIEFESKIDTKTTFGSFQYALDYVFNLSLKKRFILVIDEYPYVARAVKSLSSTLQLLIDKYKDKSHLMIILCGSSMSYMEDNILSYKAPLYGRKTSQIEITPFTFAETCSYLNDFSKEDKAVLYGVFGGTPQYLLQIDHKLSVEDNIKNNFLNPNSSLYEEPLNLLKQEVREVSLYNAIIGAIASGASKMSEISNRIGVETNLCSTYLKNLLTLGIIIRETPYGEDISRKAIYSLSDNMFRFYYRFVIENYSLISRGGKDIAYRRIKPYLSNYMGKVFEDICKQYLWKLLLEEKSPIEFNSLGRWWGNNPFEKKQVEIDIMAKQDKNTALFSECKWTNEKIDSSLLLSLINKSKIFSYKNVYYFLFSKSGFTDACIELTKAKKNVFLISYNDMFD